MSETVPQLQHTGTGPTTTGKKLALAAIMFLGTIPPALVWFVFGIIVAGSVISGLPRAVTGEIPDISKTIVFNIVFLLLFAFPACLALWFVRNKFNRIACLLALGITMVVVFTQFGGLELLDKAWRRGL